MEDKTVGEWLEPIEGYSIGWICLICGAGSMTYSKPVQWNYCPNCGHPMKKNIEV